MGCRLWGHTESDTTEATAAAAAVAAITTLIKRLAATDEYWANQNRKQEVPETFRAKHFIC